MQSEELFALADQLRELKETKKYAEQDCRGAGNRSPDKKKGI